MQWWRHDAKKPNHVKNNRFCFLCESPGAEFFRLAPFSDFLFAKVEDEISGDARAESVELVLLKGGTEEPIAVSTSA